MGLLSYNSSNSLLCCSFFLMWNFFLWNFFMEFSFYVWKMNFTNQNNVRWPYKVMPLSGSNRFPGRRHLISTNFHTIAPLEEDTLFSSMCDDTNCIASFQVFFSAWLATTSTVCLYRTHSQAKHPGFHSKILEHFLQLLIYWGHLVDKIWHGVISGYFYVNRLQIFI